MVPAPFADRFGCAPEAEENSTGFSLARIEAGQLRLGQEALAFHEVYVVLEFGQGAPGRCPGTGRSHLCCLARALLQCWWEQILRNVPPGSAATHGEAGGSCKRGRPGTPTGQPSAMRQGP